MSAARGGRPVAVLRPFDVPAICRIMHVQRRTGLVRPATPSVMNRAIHPFDPVRIGTYAQQRLLAACLLASVAAHALLLVLLPGWAQTRVAPPTPLQLVIVPAVPVAVLTPVPAPAPVSAPVRRIDPVSRPSEPRESRSPVRALATSPETPASPAAGVAVTGRPAASPQSAPVTRQAAAPALRNELAQSPPVFNAAYLRNPPPRYPPAARRLGKIIHGRSF